MSELTGFPPPLPALVSPGRWRRQTRIAWGPAGLLSRPRSRALRNLDEALGAYARLRQLYECNARQYLSYRDRFAQLRRDCLLQEALARYRFQATGAYLRAEATLDRVAVALFEWDSSPEVLIGGEIQSDLPAVVDLRAAVLEAAGTLAQNRRLFAAAHGVAAEARLRA